MPIGTISSPATWVNGTTAQPSWFQNVQDSINSWIAGTGPTFKSLEIDGTGGNASAISSGTLKVSNGATITAGGLTVTAGGLTVSAGGAAITGNSTVTGTFSSTAGTSKTIWLASSSWTTDNTAVWQGGSNPVSIATGINAAIYAQVELPYASSTTTITRVDFYLIKIDGTSTAVSIVQLNPTTGGTSVPNTQSSTSVGIQTISFTGLSLTLSDTVQFVLKYKLGAGTSSGDQLLGAKVTYTSTVF